MQSVVDIDGTATFIDPGNIEKEKRGPLDTNTRLIGATFDEKPEVWREASPITHVHRGSAPLLFAWCIMRRPQSSSRTLPRAQAATSVVSA